MSKIDALIASLDAKITHLHTATGNAMDALSEGKFDIGVRSLLDDLKAYRGQLNDLKARRQHLLDTKEAVEAMLKEHVSKCH